MLKKAIVGLTFSALMVTAAFSQAQPVDDYKKAEFFVGYSNGQVDTGVDSGDDVTDFFDDRLNFNGVNVSGVYNVNRYFGIKGDMSATFNGRRLSGTFTDGAGNVFTASADTSNQLYNFVGGVQVKDNSKSGVFKPFAHAMVGVGHARNKVNDFTCTSTTGPCTPPVIDETFSSTGLAGVIGGGIDFRVSDKFQIRAIQVDYNPIRVYDATGHNLRIGAGIVF